MSQIGAISGGISQLFAPNRAAGAANAGAAAAFGALGAAASSAGGASILPPSGSKLALSFEMLLALQGEEPRAVEPVSLEPPSAEELFLEEARKSPIDRLREQILEEMGLTEESLAALPASERLKIEDKVREVIEEKLRQASGLPEGGAADSEASVAVEGLTLA